jgi:hypothetical protein
MGDCVRAVGTLPAQSGGWLSTHLAVDTDANYVEGSCTYSALRVGP